MPREVRFVPSALKRGADGKFSMAGVASVYDRDYDAGYFTERIKRGAFDDVLRSNPDVRCLFNHDVNNLLGRTKSGTLSLNDQADGLHFECKCDQNSRVAQDVLSMIERGDVDGCSFSFDVGEDNWTTQYDDAGRPARYLREITRFANVYDVGPVTFPAYTDTSVKTRALWPEGVPAEIRSHVPELRGDGEKTKKVAGESLTRKCFLLAGDPDKTDTWELPWKFSTDEKTKSHLRDALSRFDQVEGYSEEALDKAWHKLLMLCDHYDIDVADKSRPAAKHSARAAGEGGVGCNCPCEACLDGHCEDCDCTGCQSVNCAGEGCGCEGHRSLLLRARAAASMI